MTREQHSLGAEIGTDLIGARLGRDDEAFVRDPPGPCQVGRETDRREDVEIVRLSGVKGLAVDGYVRELHAGRVDSLAFRPGVGLLGSALRMIGRV